jgi:dolichol-phosphate mannosyltransferase
MKDIATPPLDLSVLMLAGDETSQLQLALAGVRQALEALKVRSELIVIHQKENGCQSMVEAHGGRLLTTEATRYGAGVRSGFTAARGDFVLTLDADQDGMATLITRLWENRNQAEVLIASRYCPGGEAAIPRLRRWLSRALNLVFSRGLDLKVQDMSSGFRLYRRAVLQDMTLESEGYDLLQEVLVRAMMEGYRLTEVPFRYCPRDNRQAYRRVFRFGLAYMRTFSRLWRLRNSILSADYDGRAYDALMPPQRYWQRQRHRHITALLQGEGACLDVGCGSSRIMEALPAGSLALDILLRKLRYARRYGVPVLQGSLFALPVPAESFACVLCSQVIEHVPRPGALDELDRVLKPGGLLILGTPDYGNWQWRVIEWLYQVLLPQAYADEHVTHYTFDELHTDLVEKRDYRLEAVRYILRGELILALRKRD